MSRFMSFLFALLVIGTANGQQYPDKPIRIIVPFPAGDGIDTGGAIAFHVMVSCDLTA